MSFLKVIFFGTPEFAIQPLSALLNSKHEVIAVVTQPDRQSGRGKHVTPSNIKLEAEKAGLRILQPQNVKDADFIRELRRLNPSVIVVVAYGQILPVEIVHLPEFGCVNIHASLLPRYRGAAPINWAIINGETITGITTMLMDEGMDTGPILLQKEVSISPDDTAVSLSIRLSKIGADILIQTLEGMKEGNLKPKHQVGDVSYARSLRKTDGLIKWSRSAKELCNLIRGMNPWPSAYSFLGNERIKILKARHINGGGEIGVITDIAVDAILVGTGKGLLAILEIQPAGKTVMSVKSFLQGRKITKGMRFYEYPMD